MPEYATHLLGPQTQTSPNRVSALRNSASTLPFAACLLARRHGKLHRQHT